MTGYFTQRLCACCELHRPNTFRARDGHAIGATKAHFVHGICGQRAQFGHIGFTVSGICLVTAMCVPICGCVVVCECGEGRRFAGARRRALVAPALRMGAGLGGSLDGGGSPGARGRALAPIPPGERAQVMATRGRRFDGSALAGDGADLAWRAGVGSLGRVSMRVSPVRQAA